MLHYRPVFYVIGILLIVLSIAMLVPAIVDGYRGDAGWSNFVISSFLTAFFGISLALTNQDKHAKLSVREAFILTTLSWVVLALFASIPLYMSTLELSFTDAFFESMSGLTTTGATVLIGLDDMSKGILIWRAILQWLGGVGIIVVAMAVLPMLNIGGMQLFRTESSDKSDKIMPRATQIAAGISTTYIVLTGTCAVILWMLGMTGFDAICHAMTTIATAGFSTHDESIGYFNNARIELVIAIFMIMSALPYVLYIQTMGGNVKAFFRDSQVKWFIRTLIGCIMVMALWLHYYLDMDIFTAVRHSLFNITSIATTTGFTSQDYSLWGGFALTLIFMLSVMGGCTGSTTGGIKIFRYQILSQTASVQINRLIHPHAIYKPKFNNRAVSEAITSSVMSFFILFACSFLCLSLLLSFTGLDFLSSMSASAATMANVGPALGPIVGPSGNFAPLTDAAKWFLMFGMLLGRLEIFTVLVLFSKKFWED